MADIIDHDGDVDETDFNSTAIVYRSRRAWPCDGMTTEVHPTHARRNSIQKVDG